VHLPYPEPENRHLHAVSEVPKHGSIVHVEVDPRERGAR
jgi:hypothetical protein